MEPFTIENAKTRFFESKEHYLNFRQAWKNFHNSDKLVWHEDVEVYCWSKRKNIIMKNVRQTSLNAEHYMLYNLLRGYDIQRGFTEDAHHGWCMCEAAIRQIIWAAQRLKDVNNTPLSRERARKTVNQLLLPFSDTVSHQMLYDIGKHLHETTSTFPFSEFEVEKWKIEEELRQEEFRNELKNPKTKSLKDKLLSWRSA